MLRAVRAYVGFVRLNDNRNPVLADASSVRLERSTVKSHEIKLQDAVKRVDKPLLPDPRAAIEVIELF